MRRIVKTIIDSCDKILIFQDADGRNRDEVFEEVKSHLRELAEFINKRIFIIIFNEEWIIPNTTKPANYLKQHEDYEKSSLPAYADRVDFNAIRNLRSFKDFLSALNDD